MDAKTLRLKLAGFLGYEMVRDGRYGALCRNGKQLSRMTDDLDPDGWEWNSIAFHALMPHLIETMTDDPLPYFISRLFKAGGVWFCSVDEYAADGYFECEEAPTLEHAIADVFVQMCEAGLIDGKTAVLS